jgi:tetratricopeptide (TPR) repeat protein/predicted Ser/Thr protein kinase
VSATWKRIEPFVDEALEADASERQALLERIARADPPLARDVEAFLVAERAARAFLAVPVGEQAVLLLGRLAGESEPEGEEIGPYRVARELGRGGMGAVFLAHRADGQFEQEVALKLVKRGMDSAEIVERFRAERQILARLHHPNIARLLDGGVTRSGQPYFAMEYVDGLPLGAFCELGQTRLAERLRLFLEVCDAVDYAHRNLVVHRDIKPSNILVTADGKAVLVDFGIAKVLDPAPADGAVTRPEARAWTPRYAAPEQLAGQAITTATDVYSLGVVLYELVAGRHPFASPGQDSLDAAGAAPLGDAEREPAPLRGLGDLDAVARMALRREPERRYPSARALADDIRNYRAGLPVAARPDRVAYRAARFARRHRLGLAAAGVVVAALLAGAVGIVWQARRAIAQQEIAEAQARRAEAVKKFALGLFEVSDPDASRGRDITARELLERGAERVGVELDGQPEVQAEMLLAIGEIEHRLGFERESRPLFERALDLRRDLFDGDNPAVLEAELAVASAHWMEGDLDRADRMVSSVLARRRRRGADPLDVAKVAGWLGRIRYEKDDLATAPALLDEAIAGQRGRPGVEAELARNLAELGYVVQRRGDLDGAERLQRESLAIRRGLFGDEHTSVADSMRGLADVMDDRGDSRGAEALLRQVLALDRRLLGPSHRLLATDLNNMAVAILAQGERAPEAERMLRESLEIRRAVHGADSPALAVVLHHLARAVRPQARLEESEALSRQALAMAVAALGEEHVHVASVRVELARTLGERQSFAEAEREARRALATYRRKLGPDHARVAEALVVLGRILVAAGRAVDAEAFLREAVAIRRARFGDKDRRTAEAERELAGCLAALSADRRSSRDGPAR